MQKDFLGLRDTSYELISEILNRAKSMKQSLLCGEKLNNLAGKSIVTLFYENSTRTRLSFELAAKQLSATTSSIAAQSSSVQKGETLLDTGKTLSAMRTDMIVMRTSLSGAPHLLSRHVPASVINGGDGTNEHPTQALLDMFTMVEKKGDLRGLNVTIAGDVLHSRVAKSNIFGLIKMGANVVLLSPGSLLPPGLECMGVTIEYNKKKAFQNADVIMGLRIQLERQRGGLFPSVSEYNALYGLTEDMFDYVKPDVLILHPGPMNRGVEIDSAVADSTNSAIEEQVTNGVAVRMALLSLLSEGLS